MYERLRNLEYVTINGKHNTKQLHNIVTLSIRSSSVRKKSIMYLWTATVENMKDKKMELFSGRTQEDLKAFFNELIDCVRLGKMCNIDDVLRPAALLSSKNIRPIIHVYDHNLSNDFQFMRNSFEKELSRGGDRVMARAMRKPIQAKMGINGGQIILHDTSLLVPKSISEWAEDSELPIKKEPEPKDCSIKTPATNLSIRELAYSFNDNLIVAYGMSKYRDKYTKLYKIPVSQAGEVRRECTQTIMDYNKEWIVNCQNVIKSYTFDLYNDLCRAFIGGSVHTNRTYRNVLLTDVKSFDLGSAYPSILATRKFPVSEWEKCENKIQNDKDYFYLYQLELKGVSNKYSNSYFPAQKCDILEGDTLDDGNVDSADRMVITVTDIDFEIMSSVYNIEEVNVLECQRSKAGYLPDSFVRLVLRHYANKTELKGTYKKSKYNESKTYNNCFYGVFVTRNITDDIYFKEGWDKVNLTEENFKTKIAELSKKNIFTTYQIGVWVTAYCRQMIWNIIPKLDSKVVYFDTDCIKGLFTDEEVKLFSIANSMTKSYIETISKSLGIELSLYSPKTKDGIVKTIGYFEKEKTADEFKTIGTKRYAASYNGEIETTIAGLSKEAGKNKIKSVDSLRNGMSWSEEESLRFTTVFLDQQKETTWTDRDGNDYIGKEIFGVSMIPSTFVMEEGTDDWCYSRIMMSGGKSGTYFDRTEVFRDL